jgi:exopolysaccharide biosynthesis protein
MLHGRQRQAPGFGPLSVGVAFDSSGSIHWIAPDSLGGFERGRGLAFGFQSYPRLLADGVVPTALRTEGLGVDLGHRDARAALGETRDGRVLLAITRYDGVGGLLDFVPFGLTVPEMAAVMGGLGSANAVLLDGGISSQLLVREPRETHRWRGLRAVPMGLLVEAR